MTKPELIIFDLDGTLLDTLAGLAKAYNGALTALGYPTHPTDDFRNIIGDGARVAAQRCLPEDQPSETAINQCLTQFQLRYEQLWKSASPYPDINNLLTSLPKGIKLGVLSNKDDRFTQQCVAHFFPETFHFVLGHRPGLPHKPAPDAGDFLMASLGVSPDASWLVGDTGTDMNTAAACKVTGVGVLWGFRDREELVSSGAEILVDAPLQILELLN